MANAAAQPVMLASSTCVYVDKRLSEDLGGLRIQGAGSTALGDAAARPVLRGHELTAKIDRQMEELRCNIKTLLSEFEHVHLCTSSTQCLRELDIFIEQGARKPVVVIVDTPIDHKAIESVEGGLSQETAQTSEHQYGLALLQTLGESRKNTLLLTVAMLRQPAKQWRRNGASAQSTTVNRSSPYEYLGLNDYNIKAAGLQDPIGVKQVCNVGAVDVVMSPLQSENLRHLKSDSVLIQTMNAPNGLGSLVNHKIGRASLLGYESRDLDTLRRAQLLGRLLHTVLNPQRADLGLVESVSVLLDPHRRQQLIQAISSWRFPAHDYGNEDLEHVACLMLEHCTSTPGLERYQLSRNQLGVFVRACRRSYNESVPYHNFRHVIDVMQATFYFLLQLGIIPPFSEAKEQALWKHDKLKSPIATILEPVDALTLLVAAIGHDLGHPGLNNMFLARLRAPLAQMYSDNSVLENFHSAAHTQILWRYWTAVFDDESMRKTLGKSILATDMFLHNKYIHDMEGMKRSIKELQASGSLNPEVLKQHKVLTCGLLLKCADISNVARPYDIALKWGQILQLEFAAQSDLASRLRVDSCLFGGRPEVGNQAKLAKSQTGFMNMFAKSLFAGVAEIFPAMSFSVMEMEKNTDIFENIASKAEDGSGSDGGVSPKSRTPERHRSETGGDTIPPDLTTSDLPQPQHGPAGFGTLQGTSTSDPVHKSSADSQPLSPRSGNTPPNQNSSRRSSSNIHHPNSGESRRQSAGGIPQRPPSAFGRQQVENKPPSKNESESDKTLSPPSSTPTVGPERSDHSSSGGDAGAMGGFGMDGASDDPTGSTFSNSYRSLHSNNYSNYSSPRFSSSHSTAHHRDSSVNHSSSITSATPHSPATTQATSFITDSSDEKGYSGGHADWSPSSRKKSVPDAIDVERPGSGTPLASRYAALNNLNPKSSASAIKYGSLRAEGLISRRDIDSQPVIQRKSSRFKIHHLWKKARKSGGSGVEGTP